MKRALILACLAALAACQEPPKPNYSRLNYESLQDLWKWDPYRGGVGDPFYDGLMAQDPKESVPVLIQGLRDMTPTKIDDGIHPVPTVGEVCLHMLLAIFQLTPKDFEDDGIWVMRGEPNPIYAVRMEDAPVRQKVAVRFHKLARERGWSGPEPK